MWTTLQFSNSEKRSKIYRTQNNGTQQRNLSEVERSQPNLDLHLRAADVLHKQRVQQVMTQKNLDTAEAPKSLCHVANVTVTFAEKENADCTTRLSIHLFLFFDSYASCMQQVCFFGEIFYVA
jgi:hypothetical protein